MDKPSPSGTSGQSSFDYTFIRVVPHVEREEFINAGVIVCCLTKRFLKARIALDEQRLKALAPAVSIPEIQEHLKVIVQICEGDPEGEKAPHSQPRRRNHR